MSEPTPRIRSCTTDTLGGGAEIGVFCDSICATPNQERNKPLQDTLQASPSLMRLLQFIIMLQLELAAVEKGWG